MLPFFCGAVVGQSVSKEDSKKIWRDRCVWNSRVHHHAQNSRGVFRSSGEQRFLQR